MSDRLRVGVVGCGVIAQVMHLVHINELDDTYQLAALCDLSEPVLEACARRFGPAPVFTNYEELLAEDLDAVLVLTAGSHAPIAVAAANAGHHVFVEKPMCYSVDEGREMMEAARSAGVVLMVGTHKRYDPAYERLLEFLPLERCNFVQSTTIQSPWQPYVQAYPIAYHVGAPPANLESVMRADAERLVRAYPEGDDDQRYNYRWTLLDDLVHELNMLRGAIGEPDRVEFADVSRSVTLISLRFGDIACHMSWLFAEEGMARYRQELEFVGMERRLILTLPSPFLRAMPSQFAIEGGDKTTPHSWRTIETLSYEEAFRRELVEFADCIRSGREPRTNVIDALHDVALCAAIADCHQTREPVEAPSRLPAWAEETVAMRS
jgi:predicted dehydrogenase